MKLILFFGDKTSSINPDDIRGKKYPHKICTIFQHQIHGNKGLALIQENKEYYKKCLLYDSDYLITNIPLLRIGVLTADCLPIALADEQNNAIGIVHAGWQGTVSKIVINALRHMQTLYGTNFDIVKVYFGPCALPCCYEIDQPFIDKLPEWAKKHIINNTFDIPGCNIKQLMQLGVKEEHIDRSQNVCTICNENFCSHRKNPSSKSRQMSIISLH